MSGHSFVKCEALKYAYRQSKDGFIVSFVIDPHNMPPELALAPVGTRVLLAVAEITDDAPEPETPAPAKNTDKAEAARERYRAQDKMAQAAQRAAMLCKDMAFRRYVATRASDGTVIASEDGCTKFVRDRCRIDSRSKIASDQRAYEAFLALELEYKAYRGQFAEARQ